MKRENMYDFHNKFHLSYLNINWLGVYANDGENVGRPVAGLNDILASSKGVRGHASLESFENQRSPIG